MRRTSILALVTVGLVVLTDALFFEQPTGWTAGAYLALLIGLLGWRGWRTLSGRPGIVLLTASVCVAAAMVEEPGALEYILGAVCLLAVALTGRAGWTPELRRWGVRLAHLAISLWLRPFHDARLAQRWQGRHGESHEPTTVRQWLRRWGLTLGFCILFIALFAAANPIVERWLRELGNTLRQLLIDFTDYAPPQRIAFWLVSALILWMLWRTRTPRSRGHGKASDQAEPSASHWLGDRTVIVRALVLFNVLFAVQTVMDAMYLWRGMALPEGVTYADYAHRGAYPLVATALLAGLFVLITFRPGGPAERSGPARRLVYAWLVQNAWLMVSSARRLDLYVDVYSLTRWRIAAAVWMGVIALGLVWIIVRIVRRRSNVWLLRANILSAFVVCLACCFVNFDGLIADFNVRHCRELERGKVELDVDYLAQLGYESIGALRWFANQPVDAYRAAHARRTANQLEQALHGRMTNWRTWTWRRHRVARTAGMSTPPPPAATVTR